MKIDFKKFLPHLIALAVFIILLLIYFQPVTEGYKLRQHDNITFKGISKEIRDYREKFGDEPLWTNTPFGGMPAALISIQFNNNWMNTVERIFELWLPHPVNLIFICMLGFYILFLCLKTEPILAAIGAIAFGFSTYTFLITGAGHNTKVIALAWMAPVIGGVIYTYRQKALWGAAITMLFFALELRANHLQVTYYLLMILFFYGIFEGIRYIQQKQIKSFIIRSAFVLVGLGVAVLPNYSMLKSIMEIAGETTRGESKLTINAKGESNKSEKTSGLDRDYITDWSYGKQESFNLLIPNAMGGASQRLENHPEVIEAIENQGVAAQIAKSSAYWGPQVQGTGGPTYLGAVIITLFLLSFIFIKDITKWGFLCITVLGLMLAWGRNYPGLTDFFIDNIPGYNKFRAVTIILVILQVTVPFLAIWGVQSLVKNREEIFKNIKRFYILGGVFFVVVFVLTFMPGTSFTFMSGEEKTMFADAAMKAGTNIQEAEYYNVIKRELINARYTLYFNDAIRMFALVLLTLGMIYLFIRNFVNKYVLFGVLGVLILIDMWSVDVRFLNNDTMDNGEYISWVQPQLQEMPNSASKSDYGIFSAELRDQPQLLSSIQKLEADYRTMKEERGDENTALTAAESDNIRFRELNFATDYRVLNLRDPFNDGRTSYFHKSIGGYHGAKQKRIQEIIEFHYQREMTTIIDSLNKNSFSGIANAVKNSHVLNMMNAKYIVFNPNADGMLTVLPDTFLMPTSQPGVIRNETTFGNGWFVSSIIEAKNDDDEILSLGKIDLRKTAILQKNMITKIGGKKTEGAGKIKLISYRPNKLEYSVQSNGDNIALFSEIYTDYGWKATIDGKETPIARANYLIRAIRIPKGDHKVIFSFDSPSYRKGEKVSLAGSALLLILFAFALYKTFFGKSPDEEKNAKPENSKIID